MEQIAPVHAISTLSTVVKVLGSKAQNVSTIVESALSKRIRFVLG